MALGTRPCGTSFTAAVGLTRRWRRCSQDSRQRRLMPEISRFYGIVIKMYFADHAPPHFHAEYAEFEARIAIETMADPLAKIFKDPDQIQVMSAGN